MARVISDACISCGSCAAQCPVEAIAQGDQTYMKSNRRLSFNDSLLCLYWIIQEWIRNERMGCRKQPILCVSDYALLIMLY